MVVYSESAAQPAWKALVSLLRGRLQPGHELSYYPVGRPEQGRRLKLAELEALPAAAAVLLVTPARAPSP